MNIREIARETGVAPSTISRLIKDPDSVKKTTKDKVYKILKEKGKIGLITHSLIQRLVIVVPELENTFYAQLCRGAIMIAQENKIPCEIFLSFEDKSKEEEIFDQLRLYHNTGIIWTPTATTKTVPSFDKCILLNIDRDIKSPNIKLKVLSENVKASEKAVELMLKKGRKNPIMITGNQNLSNAKDRSLGFINTLKKHKFDDISSRVFYADFNDSSSAYKITKEILSKKSYDSILIGNYILALGVIKAIKELNIDISKDIYITTFDSVPGEEISKIPITEVIFSGFDMGQEAVSLLLKQTSYKLNMQQISHFNASFFVRN